ncbi:hypothetical protein KR032_006915, partial [Drosophila birchii]
FNYKKKQLITKILFQVAAKFEFTNVKCVPYDLKFNDFENCYLKSVNRTYKYVSIKCRLFQTPVTKVRISSKFEFTNLQCETFDPTFNDFECCFLKSVNRTYKYLSMKTRLHQNPVTNIKFHLSLFQRLNGYKPFLYNITIDACKFQRNRKKYPVIKFFFDAVEPYSNMNHTCPYSHDVIIDKLPGEFVNRYFTDILPFPRGNYLFEASWIAYDITRAVTKFYFNLS